VIKAVKMNEEELCELLNNLVAQPNESQWVEFKKDYADPEMIGQRISPLANGACLHNQQCGYLVFGVEDTTHNVVGTQFSPRTAKKGNEEIENWIAQRLGPRIDFRIYEFKCEGKPIALFEIPAAQGQPVKFCYTGYVRVGSITRKLDDFPEKEKKIWRKQPEQPFESEIAAEGLTPDQVTQVLDCQSYFDLMKLPFPSTREAILAKLKSEKLILFSSGFYNITNLGAVLFAKNLNDFEDLARKAIRVVIYNAKDRIKTLKDFTETKGYAVGFEGIIDYINDKLPSNEEIGKAFRETVRMYPELAIRELVANALIHQDFKERGTGPVVEIFSDRIEISNPGKPIITTLRFIDEYQSRNEKLAMMMRRLRICEEKGSGIDKVIFQVELFQLPAPLFIAQEKHTKVVMYSYRKLNEMDKDDKIRACYQHCCLKYVSNEKMTNQSLRDRFKNRSP
jgi:predicted HTH transcriptional regulator